VNIAGVAHAKRERGGGLGWKNPSESPSEKRGRGGKIILSLKGTSQSKKERVCSRTGWNLQREKRGEKTAENVRTGNRIPGKRSIKKKGNVTEYVKNTGKRKKRTKKELDKSQGEPTGGPTPTGGGERTLMSYKKTREKERGGWRSKK